MLRGPTEARGLRSSPPVNVEELLSIGGGRGKVVLTVSRID